MAGSPFAYISYHHVPAQLYGVLFGGGIVGLMAANFINARLVMRFGSETMLVAGNGAAALAGAVLAVDSWTGWGGLAGLAAPLFAFVSAAGFIIANAVAGAMGAFQERAGAVSALVGAIQYGAGMVGSGLVGALADGTPWPMGMVIAAAGLGGLVCTRLLRAAPVRGGRQQPA